MIALDDEINMATERLEAHENTHGASDKQFVRMLDVGIEI
jgi:hypothetical protein